MKIGSKPGSVILLVTLLSIGLISTYSQPVMPAVKPNTAAADARMHDMTKQMALHNAMRKLWEDHIAWTRLFIVSAAADLPDKAATTERLLQNQTDIGNAIKPYY